MKNRRIVFSLWLALGTASLAGCSQPPVTPASDHAAQYAEQQQLMQSGLAERIRISGQPLELHSLEARQAHYKVPAVSMAFMRDGKIIWTLLSGVKDTETGTPVDAESVFQAGSISKPAFATVLMKYRQDHPLDLDTDVNNLLTSWQLPEHAWSGQEAVTLRRLLSHTAGTTVHGFPGYAAGEPVPTLQQVLEGAEPANTDPVIVDIQPGSRMRYSGGGTTLAQLTLQDVSGEHLTPMADRLLFGPLKMSRSGFVQPITTHLAENMATPYRSDGSPVEGGPHTYATLAAAGMWSTPSDMLKMAGAVRDAYKGTKTDWISQQTAVDMLTTNAPSDDDANVGVGFFLDMRDDGSIRGFGHGGVDEGFIAQLYLELESGNGYAIMTNSDNGMQLIREMEVRISEAFGVGDNQPVVKTIVDIPATDLSEYVGAYAVTSPVEVDVVLEPGDNGLILTASPYVENEMHWHQGEGEFFAKDGTRIWFERDDTGAISTLVMSNGIRGARKD